MKSRPLWQIQVRTAIEAEEAVAELLERLFNTTPHTAQKAESELVEVRLFLEDLRIRPAECRRLIQAGLKAISSCGLPAAPGSISIRRLPARDWVESWKQSFRRLDIAGALLIRPSWRRFKTKPGQKVILLDPGLSFGTGHHPTTAFCLHQLVACRELGQRQAFLDMGTGSGLLAIAAAKLGYSPVRAFDWDRQAVEVARANARRNRVARHISIARQDLRKLPSATQRRYDVICANLIDSLLIEESARIAAHLQPRGTLVLAGILATQFEKVARAYRQCGLRLITSEENNSWKSGAFRSEGAEARS